MMLVERIGKEQWQQMEDHAHLAIFAENPPETQGRMDFALLVVDDDNGTVLQYVTCKELDDKTLYWGYGGSFPSCKGTVKSWQGYQALTRYCKEMGYEHIFTLIENTNRAMLKFALKIGYKIIGIRHVDGSTMLEHVLELNGKGDE